MAVISWAMFAGSSTVMRGEYAGTGSLADLQRLQETDSLRRRVPAVLDFNVQSQADEPRLLLARLLGCAPSRSKPSQPGVHRGKSSCKVEDRELCGAQQLERPD